MVAKVKITPKTKPKRTGVTKQLKAAAKRAGFVKDNGTADVAAYRRHKEAQAGTSGKTTKGRSDTAIAEGLGITVPELHKRREASKQASLKAEAKKLKISVAKVKELREERKVKRAKKTTKRKYKANKEEIKKLVDAGVDEKLAKQVLGESFRQLSKEKQLELKQEVSTQKAVFKKKPTIISTADKPMQVPRVPTEGTDPVRQRQTKERVKFRDQKQQLISARKKARKAEAKLQKLINSKTNVKANKNKLKNTQEELKNLSEAISNKTSIPEKKLRGLNIALDIVLEAPDRGRGLNVALEEPHPLAKKIRKKEVQRTQTQQDIIKDLTGKGISQRLATKVATAAPLTKAERKQLQKIAGVRYIIGKPGSARAPTPLKRLTEIEKDLQKITKEPTPEKWPSLTGLQTVLQRQEGVEKVGPVPRKIGKTGGGRGKLLPGNLTAGQAQELLRGKALTKNQRQELEGMLKDPDSELSEVLIRRKKGGTVFRRGGGKALRGFGKATYSDKLY
jgi:DNA repair exonuclease SbcCD ATPase subunit